jgi:cytochrome c biogenesis protein CcdA
MSAISLNKQMFLRIAYFSAGVVATFVLLEASGVQRVNSWTLLGGWLLVLSGVHLFSRRRTR